MDGDQTLASKEKNTFQSVTSVGSSWIICRSKSHCGRIYYFNTLTGEAAWNLSESEIEKAKKTTKLLQSQSGTEYTSCPEPKEPPTDFNSTSKTSRPPNELVYRPARVYNKQIINNQFPKQSSYAPFTSQCSTCNNHIARSSIDAMGVNIPVPHNCTPNIWAIPPNHQIVIAPSTTSPLLNQGQTSTNIGHNNVDQNVPIQNTGLPLSRRFQQLQSTSPGYDQHTSVLPFFKKLNNNDSNDLRQKISARRLFRWSTQADYDDSQVDGENTGDSDKTLIQIIKPTIEAISPSDADDEWLQENGELEGTQFILNIAPLKKIVTSGDQSLCWFVVADTNVLLNNINFINAVVNSDGQCQLMVPDNIMAELQNKSRLFDAALMSRALHVLQTLSRLFATGSAVIGKDPVSEMNNEILQVFRFCNKLTKQDHDVVLVSNNIQLEKYRSASNIPMLSISELKKLLTKDVLPQLGRKILCPLKDITITVPNDVALNETSIKIPSFLGNKTQPEDYKPLINNVQYDAANSTHHTVSKQLNANLKANNAFMNEKSAKDVYVQTDFQSMFIKQPGPKKVDIGICTESNLTGYVNDNEPIKRGGIQLKRNLSHQPTVDNNIERKQFKWRRRKRIESAPNNNVSNEKSDTSDPNYQEDMMKNDQVSTIVKNVGKEFFSCQGRTSCYDEPNDSSETGSSCCIQKNTLDNIIIEETSTSGMISNSASNVDSEIMRIKPNEQIYNQNLNEDKCKCAMFEVESPAMEEYLKMRCDEWISRFVQIMEEVLTQTLQQDPPFENRTLPPPWSIHEATVCVKKKFSDDADVIDAANKLTGLLFKISDNRGKIKAELKPEEFMEMYSYGVYLVDSLQSVLSICEDLQTAADSLAKLLSDISDPNSDTSHVDSFMDPSTACDTSIMAPSIGSNEKNNRTGDIGKVEAQMAEKLQSPRSKYNLRSAQKKAIEDVEKEDKPVKFIRKIDIESNFFTSLSLQKINNLSDDNRILCSLDKNENKDNAATPNTSNEETQNNKAENEPKIIRNFSKCLVFEEKLQGNLNDDFNTMENNEDLEEGEIDEYDYYDDYDMGYEYFENDGFETYSKMETNQDSKEDNFRLEQEVNEDSVNVYKRIIGKLVKEMQDAFLEVHSFCEKTRDELSSVPIISSSKKFEICEKAEKARAHMDDLRKSLLGIKFREDINCGNNLHSVLKGAGIHLDVAKSEEYRDIILKYSSQANILLEAVDVVIEAVK